MKVKAKTAPFIIHPSVTRDQKATRRIKESNQIDSTKHKDKKSTMASFKLACVLLSSIAHAKHHQSIRGNNASNRLAKAKFDADARLDVEDVEFWTRMMQVASLPMTAKPTGRPTKKPTQRKPTAMPSPR